MEYSKSDIMEFLRLSHTVTPLLFSFSLKASLSASSYLITMMKHVAMFSVAPWRGPQAKSEGIQQRMKTLNPKPAKNHILPMPTWVTLEGDPFSVEPWYDSCLGQHSELLWEILRPRRPNQAKPSFLTHLNSEIMVFHATKFWDVLLDENR